MLQQRPRARAPFMAEAVGYDEPNLSLEYANEIAEQIPVLGSTIPHVVQDAATMQLLAECHQSLLEVTDYLRPSAKVTVRLALEVALLAWLECGPRLPLRLGYSHQCSQCLHSRRPAGCQRV